MKLTQVKLSILMILAIVAILVAYGSAVPAKAAEVKRIAMILPGRADDLAWNTAAYKGLEQVKNELNLETIYVEDVRMLTSNGSCVISPVRDTI